MEEVRPAAVSEHLAFNHAGGRYANDLLPLALTEAALEILVANVQRVQERLRRPILVENLSAYLHWADDALAEPDFFASIEHPARQLIDRMGACALGFDAATITGSRLEREIKRIVQVIEQYPETGRRVFQQLDQACGLFGVKRLGNDTQGCTLFDMFAVGFKHSYYPHQWSRRPATLIHKTVAHCAAALCERTGRRVDSLILEAAFKVLRLQNGADEGWRGL